MAAWVSRVDEAAVRNTQDVDILVRREDLDRVKVALGQAGFVHEQTMDGIFFLDGPDAKVRDAVHLLIAGEKVKDHYGAAAPDVGESHRGNDFRVIELQPLIEMKLNSWRDMISIGLIDASWPGRFSPPPGDRLQQLIDDPEG